MLMKSRSYTKVAAVVALFCSVWTFGIVAGVRYEHQRADRVAVAVEARHQKMLDFIVKRNPAATIRDFAALPEHLVAASERHGQDYRLVMAVIDKESEWHPEAVGAAGEIGLMQIRPVTGAAVAAKLGIPFSPPVRSKRGGYDDLGTLGNPTLNVEIGVAYLAGLVQEFGAGPTALRAYNRGPRQAAHVRPQDRYAEEIAMHYVVLAARFPQ